MREENQNARERKAQEVLLKVRVGERSEYEGSSRKSCRAQGMKSAGRSTELNNSVCIPVWEGQKGVRLSRRHKGWGLSWVLPKVVFTCFHNCVMPSTCPMLRQDWGINESFWNQLKKLCCLESFLSQVKVLIFFSTYKFSSCVKIFIETVRPVLLLCLNNCMLIVGPHEDN